MDVGFAIAAIRQGKRCFGDDAQAGRGDAHASNGYHGAMIAQGQGCQSRGGHGGTAKEVHGNAVVHLLIGQHAEELAL